MLLAPMLWDCARDRDRIKFGSTRVRLADLLLELADDEGIVSGATQLELAGRLGVHRESVSVVLGKMRREGLVRWERGRAVVDRERLMEIVERE